jgi:hypothetical protein
MVSYRLMTVSVCLSSAGCMLRCSHDSNSMLRGSSGSSRKPLSAHRPGSGVSNNTYAAGAEHERWTESAEEEEEEEEDEGEDEDDEEDEEGVRGDEGGLAGVHAERCFFNAAFCPARRE